MSHRDARVELDTPPGAGCRPAERNFLVVKEEILVHAVQKSEELGVDEHARSRDPGDGSGSGSPIGLVFPAGARYQLLPERSGEAGKGANGWLSRPVGVTEGESDDPRRSCGLGLESLDPGDNGTEPSLGDDDVGIEDEQPAAPGGAPAGVDPCGESAVVGPDHEVDAGMGNLKLGGDRSFGRIIDQDNFGHPGRDLVGPSQRPNQPKDVGPGVVVDDDDRHAGGAVGRWMRAGKRG